MSTKRRRVSIAFALFAVLAILALFVLDGAASGVASLAAMVVFMVACMLVLRGDGEAVTDSDRTGLAGWLGGYF